MTVLSVDPSTALDGPTKTWLADGHGGQVVGGQARTGGGSEFSVDDPATGERLIALRAASAADVDDAVRAARRAFDDGRWSSFSAAERETCMRRLAALAQRDRELLAQLEVLETGKLIGEARACVDELVAVLRYYAGWADKAEGGVIPAPNQFFAYTTRAPLGVCGAITPWNYPLSILSYKLAPALCMGNTVVVKPSELSPLATLHVGALCLEAGIPDGVVNIVTGAGDVGAALSSHAGIDKIAFTGSTATGTKVMTAAAAKPARVSLELGGKSAHLVFSDADLEAAAESVLWGIFTNAGQVCVAGSRLLVQDDIHDDLVAAVAAKAAALVLGHGLNAGSQMGPLITARQRESVYRQVAQAERDGATVVTGGREMLDDAGFFGQPTILTDLRPEAGVAQKELFGPVLSVLRFRDEDEAISIANGTPYGLAAGMWTSDLSRAHRLSRRLHAGSVWINTYGIFHPTLPFGGTGGSGFGRELGVGAIEHYSETKTTAVGL